MKIAIVILPLILHCLTNAEEPPIEPRPDSKDSLFEGLRSKKDESDVSRVLRLKATSQNELVRRKLLEGTVSRILLNEKYDDQKNLNLLLAAVKIAIDHHLVGCIPGLVKRIRVLPEYEFDDRRPLEERLPVVAALAEDGNTVIVNTFTGDITMIQNGGTVFNPTPPKAGVMIESGTLFSHNGVVTFIVTDFTAETITSFTATGGGKTGSSGAVIVGP